MSVPMELEAGVGPKEIQLRLQLFGRPRPDSSETKEGTRLGILLLGEARGYRDGGRRYEVTGLGSLCPVQDLPPAAPVPLLVLCTISHLGPRSTHRQRLT